MSRFRWLPVPAPPEESVRLRLAVFLNTACAFFAYATVDPDMRIWLPIAVVGLGAWLSHRWRHHSPFLVKWVLAAGMLVALWVAIDNLIRGTIDPRLSLAQLLLWLQVLNAFDLPRRKNLRVALLVAAILVVVAATLSRTIDFGYYFIAFAITLVLAEHEAFNSEVQAGPARPWRVAGVTASVLALTAVIAFPLFLAAPRQDRDLRARSLPMSFRLPLPESLDPRIRRPGIASSRDTAGTADGRVGTSDFSEQLDLDVVPAPSEAVVLRVKSDRPQYWRAMAFDHYDGRRWRMSRPEAVEALVTDQDVHRLGRPKGQVGGAQLVQTFYVERDQGNLIFAAWTPTALYFPTSLVWRDAYGGLRSPLMLEKEMFYSVVSETPAYSREAVSRLPASPPNERMRPYTALPALSDRTRALARSVTAGTETPYAKMQALAAHLQTEYTYKLDVPKAPAGREWVDFFLFEQQAGFCEQFATALAVLGRAEGIPTRLVTGFLPGDYNPFTGFFEVKGKHAHAWVEAELPGVGWIPFDPTPQSLESMWGPPDAPRALGLPEAIARYVATWVAANQAVLGGVLGLAALALGLIAHGSWRERRRLSTATLAYRRLRARLSRRGVPAEPADTPRAWLARAAARPGLEPALPALSTFVDRYEAARFGTAEADVAGAAREAERAIAAIR